MWADSTAADVSPTAANQFTIRASNGFRILSGGPANRVISVANGGTIEADGGVKADGEFQALTPGTGLILKSPDGNTCRRISIDNSGTLITTAVACP